MVKAGQLNEHSTTSPKRGVLTAVLIPFVNYEIMSIHFWFNKSMQNYISVQCKWGNGSDYDDLVV